MERSLANFYRKGLVQCAAAWCSLIASPAFAAPVLSSYWTDNAVIQRDQPVVIEGLAAPQEDIVVTLGKVVARTKADSAGRFAVSLPAMPAQTEPLQLTASGADGATHTAGNLLVGDVFLCAGQSNMELPLQSALDGWNQMTAANDAALRLMNVPHLSSVRPGTHFPEDVTWKLTTPKTAGPFSAVCYSMGAELRRKTGHPVGLINASWGGAPIRPWIASEVASEAYGPEELDLRAEYLNAPERALRQFSIAWQNWYAKGGGGGAPWSRPDELSWASVPERGFWNRWTGTPLAEDPMGTVWLRRQVNLTSQQANDAKAIDLGMLDDVDFSFVNGAMVGTSAGAEVSRLYPLRKGLMHAGRNEIVVAVTNLWGDGGFAGGVPQVRMQDGRSLSIGESWLWSKSSHPETPPRAPWDRLSGIGVMANGMIKPLGHVSLAGLVWYQGESDVGQIGYDRRLVTAVRGWRTQFGADMPVYVIQLAGYGLPHDASRQSASAALRNEQRLAVTTTPGMQLITATDLGERIDVHPGNKKEIGRRLALAVQGEGMPMPVSARREAGAVRVAFSGVSGGWKSWGGPPLGFEICGVKTVDCRFASARIEGSDIVLAGDGRSADIVRYSWADSPSVNLVDGKMVPPPTFEISVGTLSN